MLTQDYEERVYAGVLGKIVGVYLGRPFEGWSNRRIEDELGEIDYYVHDKVGVPLIVTDDDISGTFTFVRALEDYGCDPDLTPAQIGQTWLNYLIENRTVLWWGGLGNSTEHTAYLRLRDGVEAPRSGAMATNGQVVAEQIGAQIFIDGWAMVCPGDPERAADFARRAASVSHDGEAVYGAQILAAMEAQAFVEDDIDRLIDTGVALVPGNSVLYRMIGDIRDWHAKHGDDWRATFAEIKGLYGYDRYGGNCHMVPNHGLIIHALLHGGGDFRESMKIVNTSGWDTDCNSGNLGCLLGIRGGIDGLEGEVDWRGPVADICYLPSADSGRGISDAAAEARRITALGHRLADTPYAPPKNGARFHFSYPGSVQGFRGHGCLVRQGPAADGTPCLTVHFNALADGETARATTGTFVESRDTARYFERRGYGLMASPTLNPGQTVEASVALRADAEDTVRTALCIRVYDGADELVTLRGPTTDLEPGASAELAWRVPNTGGHPIASVGLQIVRAKTGGALFLDRLTWTGTPEVTLRRTGGEMWHRAWVNGVDHAERRFPESFRIVQDRGTGLLLYGNREWTDYVVAADVTPHMVRRAGIAARVQGMRRYYALTISDDHRVRLVRELDGTTVLAEADAPLELYATYRFELAVRGDAIEGRVNDDVAVTATDDSLLEGGIALLVEGGRTASQEVTVRPAQ